MWLAIRARIVQNTCRAEHPVALAATSQFNPQVRLWASLTLDGSGRPRDPNYKEGRKPFGFLPGEQATIARIQELRGQRMTLSAITQTLTAEGRKPRASERWHEKQVARIFSR
jgi:hypothetical protein